MPYKMPIGVDNFSDLLNKNNNYLYVDQSLWVKEVIEDNHAAILVTRPQRWGKTLNLSMLQYFFAPQVNGYSTQGMFDALQIAQVHNQNYMAHQGRYPVIFLSLKDIEGLNFADALEQITRQIRKCYQEHVYLLESAHLFKINKKAYEKFLSPKHPLTQAEVESSLQRLTQFLFLHYEQPVYILIDDYDSPFIHASMQGYLEKLTEFFKSFFGKALINNRCLEKAIMAGVLQITQENMLSDLNHLNVCTLLDKRHLQYFGFTEVEMNGLFQAAGLRHDVSEVKPFYNSCNMGEIVLYNPWSALNSISNNDAQPHWPNITRWVDTADWVNSSSDNLLKTTVPFVINPDSQVKFEQLVLDNSHDMLIPEHVSYEEIARGDASAIWSLLLFEGYLKAIAVLPEHTHYKCMLYNDALNHWLAECANTACYDRLLSSIIVGDVQTFTQRIHDFLLESSSGYDYTRQPAAFYQGFLLALNTGLSLTHIVELNPESSYGHSDVLYIPRGPQQSVAIILQFKRANDSLQQTVTGAAQVALAQIKSSVYEAKLSQHTHIKRLLKVGLGLTNKSVCAAYVVEPVAVNNKLTGNKEYNKASLMEVKRRRQSSKRLASECAETAEVTTSDTTDSHRVSHTVIKKSRLEATEVSASSQSSNSNDPRFFSKQLSNESYEDEAISEQGSDFLEGNNPYYPRKNFM